MKRQRKRVEADGLGCYVMPFGKHRGQTLDQICSTDDGLRWLDWAVDNIDADNVREKLQQYAGQSAVAAEIAKVIR